MGVRVQKKSNDVVVASKGVFHDKVYVAPKIAKESFEEKDYDVKECSEESTSFDSSLTEIENAKPAIQKSSDLKQTSSPASKSPAVGKVRRNCTVPQPFTLTTQKRGTCAHTAGFQTAPSENFNSPNATKNSQVVKCFKC